VSPEDVSEFFDQIEPNLRGISRHNIFNYDETCFRDDPGAEDAFFGTSCKYYEKVQNHSKTTISVMACISAGGDSIPPMTLYKSATGSVYQSWCEGGPEDATYAANQSGWYDMEKFSQWFKEVSLAIFTGLIISAGAIISSCVYRYQYYASKCNFFFGEGGGKISSHLKIPSY
jgi:hypothetical protein